MHARGGKIVAQLMHTGRIGHPSITGLQPVAPSAVRAAGQVFTPEGMQDFVEPRALETAELPGVVAEFVDAARVIGASTARILLRHLLPNLAGVIAVNISLATAAAIIVESTLSFLGFGVQPPRTSWGNMLSQAAGLVGTDQVYLLYFPGVFILLTVLSVNFIGDGLRDALDPQAKQL